MGVSLMFDGVPVLLCIDGPMAGAYLVRLGRLFLAGEILFQDEFGCSVSSGPGSGLFWDNAVRRAHAHRVPGLRRHARSILSMKTVFGGPDVSIK